MTATVGVVPDPLGAQSAIADFTLIQRWQDTDVPEYDIMVDDPNSMKTSPFSWDDTLNQKILLWSGDLTALNCEAVVNSTNESLSDRNFVSERLFSKAGPQLRAEIRNSIKSCKTGDAKITKGYKLPCRYLIHTVGPRYNLKYKTAAESALYNSYRNVLQLVRENNISSVAIPCIHSTRRGYPSFEGAHIAVRTVRRFLEKFGETVDTVIFVVTPEDEEVYKSVFPLYFPRSKSEEDFSAYHLPYDVGNEDGEPVIVERQIRINSKPTFSYVPTNTDPLSLEEDFESTININEAFETSVAVGSHAFSKMEGDLDKQRKNKLQGRIILNPSVQREEIQRRYDRWLKRAKSEDLSHIARLRCLYQSGFDKYNRPVVVFVAKYFPSNVINLEKAAMYFIQEMDSVVSQSYVVVYLHTETTKANQPQLNFVKDIYNLVDERYKRNLKAFYVVHPTFLSKMVTWFATTFSINDMKPKVHNIPGLEYLYQRIPPDQLDLPDFVLDYDMRVNGTRYYSPEEDEAIGAL